MNETMIPVAKLASSKQRKREAPRGRNVTPAALAEVEALVGKGPLRHDLLIEYLHLILDTVVIQAKDAMSLALN